jgi:hypothetical protein
VGSIPITRSKIYLDKKVSAHIAQSVERILGKDEVTSSNLVMGSSKLALFIMSTEVVLFQNLWL